MYFWKRIQTLEPIPYLLPTVLGSLSSLPQKLSCTYMMEISGSDHNFTHVLYDIVTTPSLFQLFVCIERTYNVQFYVNLGLTTPL